VADPEDDVLELTDPAQLKALAHPLRNRLLFALGQGGATVSQLAARLQTHKGNVAHHLMVLERAGLVRPGRTRTVRGGTERYWERTARRIRTPGGPRSLGHTGALLEAVAHEVTEANGEPLLHLRRLRLTRAQAAALTEHLERVVGELPEAPAGAPTHGVLVSVFEAPGGQGAVG
jgi:DNA-binding transcriptional ArsR family regulator